LHGWGRAIQTVFDSSKDNFHILHPRRPWRDDFNLLGNSFDTRLIMSNAAYEIAARAGGMAKRILRCRRVFSTAAVVATYKAHGLAYVKYSTSAIYHAPPIFLSVIDDVQKNRTAWNFS